MHSLASLCGFFFFWLNDELFGALLHKDDSQMMSFTLP